MPDAPSHPPLAFGPIPSRRLGRSLGVNNIPPKHCSYACVYCQAGATTSLEMERRSFYAPETIAREVSALLSHLAPADRPDYITFAPDGEPTLDVNLGRAIALLRPLGHPIAVVSNSSLAWRPDVRDDLARADLVSFKIDATGEDAWRRINRPPRALTLPRVLEGVVAFARAYKGTLITETMLVRGVNDDEAQVRGVAEYLARLGPARAYLAVPTRPPVASWVATPEEATLRAAAALFAALVPNAQTLASTESGAFGWTGDVERDLLSIAAVHPMREAAARHLVAAAHGEWHIVERLVEQGRLTWLTYQDERFLAATSVARPPASTV